MNNIDQFVINRTDLLPDIVWFKCPECDYFAQYWQDGTPRLQRSSVPAEYRRFVDLYHYDGVGDPIWELVVAEHVAREDRYKAIEESRLARRVG